MRKTFYLLNQKIYLEIIYVLFSYRWALPLCIQFCSLQDLRNQDYEAVSIEIFNIEIIIGINIK